MKHAPRPQYQAGIRKRNCGSAAEPISFAREKKPVQITYDAHGDANESVRRPRCVGVSASREHARPANAPARGDSGRFSTL